MRCGVRLAVGAGIRNVERRQQEVISDRCTHPRLLHCVHSPPGVEVRDGRVCSAGTQARRHAVTQAARQSSRGDTVC